MTALRFFLLAVGVTFVSACGSSDDTPRTEKGTGGASTGGASGVSGTGGAAFGSGSGGASSGDAGPCATGSTSDFSECPLLDPQALFVAPGAHGSGTRDDPLGEIGAALYLAIAGGRSRVIVCNATYAESVAISDSREELHLHGGYTCPASGAAGWERTTGSRPVVAPLKGPGLLVHDASQRVAIHDMEFESTDAMSAADSSIAAVVYGAADLQLERVEIRAGNGATGEDGVDGEDGSDAFGRAERGASVCAEDIEPNGTAFQSTCGSRGGSGGTSPPQQTAGAGEDGSPAIAGAPPESGRGGEGTNAPSTRGGKGENGADGAPGELGAAAAEAIGTFRADRYIPAPEGGDGSDGKTGQGGGGGGAAAGIPRLDCAGAGGGAGGSGGCGGKHGTGGSSGSASVALISWDSTVTLKSCSLISARGGDGGNGGNGGLSAWGHPGALGGLGTDLEKVGSGGPGGYGGRGGPGGPGAGGSGGPSFAVVFHGTEVVQVGSTALRPGPGGKEGTGGEQKDPRATTPLRAPDGARGQSAAEYDQR
jgi:hypothetical protein